MYRINALSNAHGSYTAQIKRSKLCLWAKLCEEIYIPKRVRFWQRRGGWFSAHINVSFWRKNQSREMDSARDYANIFMWGHISATFCVDSLWHSRTFILYSTVSFNAYAGSKSLLTQPFMLLPPQHGSPLLPLTTPTSLTL